MTINPESHQEEDFSGKNRIVWNTLVSWLSHLVLVVSGFIMPRLMDEFLGQLQLGIWDFCWAFISYLSLIGLGVGASSNRYVAKYRAEGDFQELNKLVSSALLLESFIFLAIFIGTLAIVFTMPQFFADKLGEHLAMTQQVMFYLGLSLAITTLFSVSRGFLTGHHRWDIHNGLTAAYSVVSLAFMMLMLFLGFGLVGMAQGYLLATIIFEVLRVFITQRYCEKVTLAVAFISKPLCWQLLGFTVKGKIAVLPPIVLLQSVNILIVNAFGPAALAIFSRPNALTRHISTFMVKFTMILTPTAGAMLAEDQSDELRDFFLTTTKFSFAFTLPLVIGLALLGDVVIELWMGADYVNNLLIITLALGALLPTAQDSALRILMAKNDHGKISLWMTVIVIVSFLIGYFFISEENFTLTVAACLFVIPRNLAYGVALPIYTCRKLAVPLVHYCGTAIVRPLMAVIPFSVLLYLTKFYYLQQMYLYSSVAFFSAGCALLLFYSLLLLSHLQRTQLLIKAHLITDSEGR